MPRFFDPDCQPTRDRYGFTAHPDLDLFSTDDDALDHAAMHDAGFTMQTVALATDAPLLLDAYLDADECVLARWEPTPPQGGGWQLVGVYDTENDPIAVFVRQLS